MSSKQFAGVDLESAVSCYHNILLENEKNFVRAYVWLEVTTTDIYSLGTCLYEEIDKPFSDVPICSFADAKAAIETEIIAGHLRTITECKLCYIPYFDREDPDVMLLIPAWVVEGGYTRNAKKEFQANYDDDGIYVDDGMEHYYVVFNANTGELIDYNDNSEMRRQAPEIVTWEHVK